MHLWKHLLHNVDFDACVDYLAIVQILKSKDMPANTRIVRLLDHLAKFKFSLYYIKGKDMILADFLSRIAVDEGDPSICEPISFNVMALRDEKFNNLVDTFCIATRNATRDKGISLPEVHGARKGVDPAFKPEHQHKSKKVLAKPVMQSQPQTKNVSSTQIAGNKILKRSVKFLRRDQKTKGSHEPPVQQVYASWIKTAHKPADESFGDPCDVTPVAPTTCQVPFPAIYRGPCHNNRPVTSQPALIPGDHTPAPARLGTPVEEADQHFNSPYSDEDLEPSFRQPTNADFVMPPLLSDLLPDKTVLHKNLPKQTDLDKLLKQIDRKILRQLRLPISLRDLQAAYMSSPHFRDIYIYLYMNKVPVKYRAFKTLHAQIRNYFLMGNLLFKVLPSEGKDDPNDLISVLCIPFSHAYILLENYHSTIIGGHMGINKTFRTIQQRFYCPNIHHYIRLYVTGCHVCQLFKNSKRFDRPYQNRTDLPTEPLSRIYLDFKHMPGSSNKYKFIFVMLCESLNYLIAEPTKTTQAPEVCQVLMKHFIRYFGAPKQIITDQDPAFLSSLCQWFLRAFGIKLITCSPTNHKSLLAEHGIKSLSNILMKHLTGLGENWDDFVDPAMLTYNTYCTLNLDNICPFQLALGKNPKIIPEIEIEPAKPFVGTSKEAFENLKQKLQYFRQRLIAFRNNRLGHLNKNKELHGYTVGQLVLFVQPQRCPITNRQQKDKV